MFFRGRRLRQTAALRSLVRETRIELSQLVYPLFIEESDRGKTPIPSMPGIDRFTLACLDEELEELLELGVTNLILFGLPAHKDPMASGAYDDRGIVQQAVRQIEAHFPGQFLIMTDVCLCEYMSHGHCGIIEGDTVLNDPSLELLCLTAVSHARAGAKVVAPSDMMDGRVAAIRTALDEAGYSDTVIMAYSAKYASGFYGPFRDAADSAPSFGDRSTYQMDCANLREAVREMSADAAEGADILMVKPALSYLDIIRIAKDNFSLPVAAYNVSGEYAMVKAAGEKGWIDENRVMQEILLSMKRAGADIIITYHAKDYAKLLKK